LEYTILQCLTTLQEYDYNILNNVFVLSPYYGLEFNPSIYQIRGKSHE